MDILKLWGFDFVTFSNNPFRIMISIISLSLISPLVPKNGDNYTYTTGIDAKDTFLFCNTEDSSVQLYNIYWRRKDGISYHTNPLDVYTLRNILILTNNQEMECFDTESGDIIMSVKLYVQGLLYTLNLDFGPRGFTLTQV